MGIILIGFCALILGLAVSPEDSSANHSELMPANSSEQATTKIIDLAIPSQQSTPKLQENIASKPTAAPLAKPENNTANISSVVTKPVAKWKIVKIKSGDNLSTVFSRAKLSDKDVYNIVQSGAEGKALTRMFPGEELAFILNANGELEKVKRVKSPLESIVFTRGEEGFVSERIQREPEIRISYKQATIKNSLSVSAENTGLSATLTMNMANIFGGVMDFVYDVREGDHFSVMYEEKYLDGKKIGNGNILAAQYTNRGKQYHAYRYVNTNGEIGYYNEDGVSMRKAFLRAPLDFTRISSNFNPKRLHPITKKVKPHRGIDYAAPTGTPIFATGDGRVSASSYSNSNGKYVFIKHGEAYVTKYLHLSKRAVKKGQRVKQGQIIGYLGCTGLCTGPHLHYEFLVNGVHRNPRTILKKLPKAKTLAKSELAQFKASISPIVTQLASYQGTPTLALNE